MVRKALLVGINYYGTSCQLSGCINDVHNMKRALEAQQYTTFRVLTDAPGTAGQDLPTKANILAGIAWLLSGTTAADHLFFHYSGHGTQTYDFDGDEADRRDEALCPLDCNTGALITDDELRAHLCDPCVANLTMVSDCCHSGTILDLRYNYLQSGRHNVVMAQNPRYGSKPNTILCLSGCLDNQTSADTQAVNPTTGAWQAQGALTATLLEVLSAYPSLSYKKLLRQLWQRLQAGGYTQVPQLSCSRYMNLADPVQL